MATLRIKLEETGSDEPPADLRYELRLDFETPDGTEDTLLFGLNDEGVAEMLEEIENIEAEDARSRELCLHCGLKPCGCWDGTTRGARA